MQPSTTILAYLVEGHPKNISLKLFENRSFGIRSRYHFKSFLFFSSGSHLVYQSGTILSTLVGSLLANIPVKSESQWPTGLRGDGI